MKWLSYIIVFLLCLILSQATVLEGSIYNSKLELEQDVIVEISTVPAQKYLAKNGTYSFELSAGEYTLTTRKGFTDIQETVLIKDEGTFHLDLFLLPDL